jgi:hypothetical protein
MSSTRHFTLSIGRRLSGDAHARMRRDPQHVAVVQDDVEVVEVFRQPAHLDVSALADDDRVISLGDESPDRPMCRVYERARRFNDLQAARAGTGKRPFRCTVRGHHHRVRVHMRRVVSDGNAPGAQRPQHRGVVNQVPEDGERRGLGPVERQRDRVAYAKAHTEMFCADDSHDMTLT